MITVTTLPKMSLGEFLKLRNVSLEIDEIKPLVWGFSFNKDPLLLTIPQLDPVEATKELLVRISGKQSHALGDVPILYLSEEDIKSINESYTASKN